MPSKFAFDCPDDALRALAEQLAPTEIQHDVGACTGRVLAEAVVADRDSPAADVSAMDGYAIHLDDLKGSEPVPISGESAPGAPPPEMQAGAVVRIFTGAIVPHDCDAVVKREDTVELEGAIQFRESAQGTRDGEHIRRAGENARAGSSLLSPGTKITAASRATMANFGCSAPTCFSSVRVCIVTTGDEVGVFADETPQPWQLRNSNRASLESLLVNVPWIQVVSADHCKDDRDSLMTMLSDRIENSDAILMTGGVSMGDYDYVPDVIAEIGGSIAFHGLPLRPGKPILGAATNKGKLIMGLPGNPVSATIGCRRMALPLLAKISGQRDWLPSRPVVHLGNAGEQTLPLFWMRLVKLIEHGHVEPIQSQGSGDLVSLGHSSGFVEVPPGSSGEGPWPYYEWA